MGSQLVGQEQEPTPTCGGLWPGSVLIAGRWPPGCVPVPGSLLPQAARALAFPGGRPPSGAAASKLLHTRF